MRAPVGTRPFEARRINVVLFLEDGDSAAPALFRRILAPVLDAIISKDEFGFENAALRFQAFLGDLKLKNAQLKVLISLQDALQELVQSEIAFWGIGKFGGNWPCQGYNQDTNAEKKPSRYRITTSVPGRKY